jgi:DtxR family Mn-dependent transcriptional regulator
MLKRLEADGLVERGEHKEAILTEAGRERAERAVRKHRIIERLLTDFMGYTAAEAHVHADELGDTFSDDMVERIRCASEPRTPSPRLADRHRVRADRELRAGSPVDLELGARATIGRARRRPAALVLRRGPVPGATVELESAEPPPASFASGSTATSARSPTRPRPGCRPGAAP